MKKNIIMLLFSFCVITLKAQLSPYVIPNTDWINYFSQTNTLVSSPSAIDVNSNVYTTGYYGLSTQSDLIALKYDSLGALTYSYSYSAGNFDVGNAIKVDAAGNAYLAGTSYTSTTKNDFMVIKLSPTGSVIWTKRIDGGLSKSDEAYDLAVDASGNVFVTGKSQGAAGFDVKTYKLKNTTGAVQWTHTFNGGSSLDDEGRSIVLSSSGNTVYVTGNTKSSTTGWDIVTMAINASNGTTNWTKIENGTASANDFSKAMILTGNDITICGEKNNTSSGVDYTTIKYNGSSGSIIWQNNYDFGSSTNRATALAKDSAGNIGVVGTALNGSTIEYHTILYNSAGTQLQTNIESTGLATINADPKICNDTIAHHWYISGEFMNASKDIFVYQITPTGNTSWKRFIDGQNLDTDVGTSIGVNGTGVVYVGARSKNSAAAYDYTTIKISQTPDYFPPDLAGEDPSPSHIFYENKGQIIRSDSNKVASNILFNSSMYPYTFYEKDRIYYKFFKASETAGLNDTVQRIDIQMVKANPLANANPQCPNHGTVSHMEAGLPNCVLGIKGYERYFIPNIYPSIDLHYYSNQNGLKMYYVLKPYADPNSIEWRINGATTTTINGTSLDIKAFNGKVSFNQPTVYTANMLGQAVSLTTTATWSCTGGSNYKMILSAYSPTMPIIIELDYGSISTATTAATDNRYHCTYYGGYLHDGIKAIDVDKNNGNYAALFAVKSSPVGSQNYFPINQSQWISIATTNNINTEFFGVILFDKDGKRLGTNTYGIPGYQMSPLKIALHRNKITVIGNNNTPHASSSYPVLADLPLYFPAMALAAGTYNSTKGSGYAIQFETQVTNPNNQQYISNIAWATRLNGAASDLTKTPDGKHLYISSITDNLYFVPADLMTQTGSYNSSSFAGTINFQISKFDSTGHRKWATIYQAPNTMFQDTIEYNSLNGVNSNQLTLQMDRYLKCKLACDNYGFSIAGQTNGSGLKIYSKYGAPVQNSPGGNRDGFYARFNKKDSIVFSSYIGSNYEDLMTGIANIDNNSTAIVGYSNSNNFQKMTTNSAAPNYIDSTNANNVAKVFVAKYDTIGNKTWGSFYGSTSGTNDIYPNAIISDQNGNIFISGRERGGFNNIATNPSNVYSNFTITGTESYLLGFNKFNQPIWNTRFGGHVQDFGTAMVFNSKNNRIILGGFANSTHLGTPNPWFPILKNPSTPSTVWYQQFLNGVNPSQQITTTYDGFISIFENSSPWVGINEYYKNKETSSVFELFPNPAMNTTNIAFKNELIGISQIIVYNELGQIVYERNEKDILRYSLIEINTVSLKAGIYIVNIQNKDKTYSKKLIIAK